MKLSLDDYEKVHNMSRNQLTKYLVEVCRESHRQGIEEGESELDTANADQWVEYIKNTPNAHEIFTITDGNALDSAYCKAISRYKANLTEKLKKFFRRTEIDMFMAILDETMTSDILWEALSESDKIQT